MFKKTLLWLGGILLAGSLSTCRETPTVIVVAQTEEIPAAAPVSALSISELYANQASYLDQTISVEGYFYGEGAYYIVDDYAYLSTQDPIPIQSILLLTGNNLPPVELSRGPEKIVLTGTLKKYNNEYPYFIDENSVFLELVVDGFQGGAVSPPPMIVPGTQPESYLDQRLPGPDCLYVLILGGGSYSPPGTELTLPYDVGFWNDTIFAYQTAVRYGADWIRVLHADGTPPTNDSAKIIPGSIPDLQAATIENLADALMEISMDMPSQCQLWFLITSHGIGWKPPDITGSGPGSNYLNSLGRIDGAPPDYLIPEGDLFPGDENRPETIGLGNNTSPDQNDDVDEGLLIWHDLFYDDTLAEVLSTMRLRLNERGVTDTKVYILMDTCFSGGFIADLYLHPQGALFDHMATAASETQPSFTKSKFGLFFYYFISALNGADPWGQRFPSLADAVDDWSKAYDFAARWTMVTVNENPQFK